MSVYEVGMQTLGMGQTKLDPLNTGKITFSTRVPRAYMVYPVRNSRMRIEYSAGVQGSKLKHQLRRVIHILLPLFL